MAANNQIDLILRAIFQGEEEFKRAQLAVARVLGATEQLGNEATKTGDKQENALREAKKKAEELAKAFENVRQAEKLLAETKGTDQEADAIKLLGDEQKKLGKVIEQTSQTDSTANKKRLSEIQQLQTQLSGLTAKQRELQAIASRSQGQNNELSTLNAQIAGLQTKITALRSGSTALGQQANSTSQSLGKLADGFSQINNFAPQSIQGLGNVTSQIINAGKAFGATGAITAGFLGITTAVTAALINQAEITAKNAKIAQEIGKSTGASAGFIGALTSVITSYGGEIQNVQELLLQVGSVINQAIAEPVGTTAEKFKKLEIAFQDVTGRARTAEQVIKDIDKAAKAGTLSTEKLAIVSTIFGEEASKQFLGRLGELEDLQKALEKTGAVLSEELTAKAQELNKSGQFLQALVTGLSQSLSGELFDALTTINKLTSEVLQNIDPTSLDALRSLIQDLGRGLVATAETGAKAFELLFEGINVGTATVIPGLADFAAATTAILNPLDTLSFLLTGNPVIVDKANISNKKLVDTFTAGTFAADALSKKIKQLSDDQNFLAQITEITANKQIALIQEQVRVGLKSEQDAKRQIDNIEDEKLLKQTDNAFDRLTKVKQSLEQETKVKEKEAKQQANIEEELKNKRIAAEQDIEKFKKESFERQFSADGKDFASQKRAEEIRQQDAATLSIKLKGLETFRNAEASAGENTKKAAKEVADFKRALNINEVIDENKLSEDKQKAREQLKSATLELRKAEEDQNKKNIEQRKNDEKVILADRQRTITDIEESEKAAGEKLTQELQKQEINREQFNERDLANKIKFAQEKLKVEELAAVKLNASENAGIDEKVAAAKRVSDLRSQIFADETKQRIDKAQSELTALKITIDTEQSLRSSAFETRKLQISQIKDLGLRAIQERKLEIDIANETIKKTDDKIVLEQKTLDLLKAQGATKEQLLAQEGKITVAIEDGNRAREESRIKDKKAVDEKVAALGKVKSGEEAINERIANSANRADSAVGKLKGGLAVVGESFNFASLSTEELNDKILQLEGNIKFIREVAAIGDKDAFINPQLEVIDKLNEEIINRTQRAELEAARKGAEVQLAERTKGAEQALDIVKDFEDEAQKIREATRAKRRELNQELAKSEKDEETELKQLRHDQEEERTAFDTEQSNKRQAKATEERLKKEEEEQTTVDNIKKINLKSREEEADERIKALTTIGEKEGQIAVLQAKAQTAETKAEIEKLQKEVKDLEAGESARKKRVEDRDGEIGKAQQTAQEKLKGAKTKEEVDAIQEELRIVTEGINDRFKIEEAKLQKLKDLQGKASKETLDGIAAEFEAKKKIALDEEKAQLESNNRKAAQQAAALAAQAAADKEAADKARGDLLKRQSDELGDRKKGFDDKQQQLRDALQAEREEYKKHVGELQTKTAEALAEIAKSFSDGGIAAEKFFKDFATSAGLTGKAIDDILKKLKAFKDEAASDTKQTNDASSSPSNAPGTSPTNTPSNNNPNSSPNSNPTSGVLGGNPSNTAGTLGTLGRGIVEQPKGDKSGNDKPGVTKGVPKTGQGSPGDSGDVSVPGSILLADRYRDICGEIFNKFDLALGGKNSKQYTKQDFDKQIKLQGKILEATKKYFDGAKIDQSIRNTINDPALYQTAGRNKNKELFITAVEFVVTRVESLRKQDSVPGDKGNDGFGDKDKPDIPTKGAGDGNLPRDAPDSNPDPPKQIPRPTPAPKDTRFDPKKENVGEGAEAEGAKLSGPNFPVAEPDPADPGATAKTNSQTTAEKTNSQATASSSTSQSNRTVSPSSDPDLSGDSSSDANRTVADPPSSASRAQSGSSNQISIEIQQQIEIKPQGRGTTRGEILAMAKEIRKEMAQQTAQEILEDENLLSKLSNALQQMEADNFQRIAPDLAFNL